MVEFTNPFLSLKGQAERFSNVGETIWSAVSGKGVTSNIKQPVLKEVVETAASYPFATALIGAGAATPAVRASVGSYLGKHKIATATTGLIGYGLIKENPKVISTAPNLPSAVIDIGGTAGKVSTSKSWEEAYGYLRDYTKEHPIASAALGGAAAYVGGKSLAPVIGGLYQGSKVKEQTAEFAKQTALMEQQLTQGVQNALGTTAAATPLSTVPIPNNTGLTSIGNKNITSYKRKKSKHLNTRPINIRNYNIMAVKNG